MPSVHETAYPRLKSNPSPRELVAVYTPTQEEMALADRVARSGTARLAFLILLKTFQRLGYFVPLRDVPAPIVEHIARDQGFLVAPANLADYDDSGTRRPAKSAFAKFTQHYGAVAIRNLMERPPLRSIATRRPIQTNANPRSRFLPFPPQKSKNFP